MISKRKNKFSLSIKISRYSIKTLSIYRKLSSMTQQGEYQPKKHSSTPTLMTLTDLLYRPASKVCLESELKGKLSKWLSLSLHSPALYARLVLVALMGCLPFTVYCETGESYILVPLFHLLETKHSLCSLSWEYFLNDVCHTCRYLCKIVFLSMELFSVILYLLIYTVE